MDDDTQTFLANVEIDDGGCWRWQGAKCGPGYGGWRSGYAHRASYELFVGPIPDGLDIDHVCHNEDESCAGGDTCRHRRCVNPDHLRAVTHEVNTHAGRKGQRGKCDRGHDLTDPANVYERPDGKGRFCRECAAIRERRRPKRLYDPAKRRRAYLRKKARDGRTENRSL